MATTESTTLLQCGDRWLQRSTHTAYRINGCTPSEDSPLSVKVHLVPSTFTDKESIYDNREMNWPVEKKQKVLYLGVRNKYCTVCNKATGGTIPQHTCFCNWTESSSAVETDIILKGFLHSKEQHCFCYTEFMRDGNSSVFPALVSGVPYGHYIKKWNVPTMLWSATTWH